MSKYVSPRLIEKMRSKSETRKREVLEAALALSKDVGYQRITSVQVAKKAGCTHGTVHRHFKTMRNLRAEVMRQAVAQEETDVVLQGLVARDLLALNAPRELRKRALATLKQT